MIYDCTIATTRTHFAICDVQRDNSNSVAIYQNKFEISESLLKRLEEKNKLQYSIFKREVT